MSGVPDDDSVINAAGRQPSVGRRPLHVQHVHAMSVQAVHALVLLYVDGLVGPHGARAAYHAHALPHRHHVLIAAARQKQSASRPTHAVHAI